MTRTFLDANVLILAFRGVGQPADDARTALNDTNREFVGSDLLRLELIPKSHYNKQSLEEQFYETYFASLHAFVETTPQLVRAAEAEAKIHGLAAADALHVTAAKSAGVVEFVTAEKSTKPLFRVTGLKITSILGP